MPTDRLSIVSFKIISKSRFEVNVVYNETVINTLKRMKSKQYDSKSRKWSFNLCEYNQLIRELMKITTIKIEPLPKSCSNLFKLEINGQTNSFAPKPTISNEEYEKVDPKIREHMFPFQIEGVKFMIARKGRCLLADDMGLGKTIQSLAVASFFRDEWPLLVICPSSVKLTWRDQVLKWITTPAPTVHVLRTARDIDSPEYRSLDRNSVVLVSYDLVSKMGQRLLQLRFKVLIMDESHFIKTSQSARTKNCIPIAKYANRTMLLSGTPALSRPQEMFTQLDCVSPSIYSGFFKEFGNRYCDPQTNKWGVDYSGASNMTELQVLLEEKIMLRRMKTDVLLQLPEKRREVIILAPEFLVKSSLKRHADIMMQLDLKGLGKREELLKYYNATAKAKIDAIKNYIDDLIESPRKFLFFAHHLEILDAVENQLKDKNVGYIRIDGSVNSDIKRNRALQFQTDDSVQVAVLSIVAAGTGITLTAASLVVFGELFWNPGILLQAEDRCHRIGQRDFVNVQYLVAEQTADDFIWPLIKQKLDLLTKVGLNKENFKNSDTVRLNESFSERQQSVLDIFQKEFIEESLPESSNVEEQQNMPPSTSAAIKVHIDGTGFDEDMDESIDWDFDDEEDEEAVQSCKEKAKTGKTVLVEESDNEDIQKKKTKQDKVGEITVVEETDDEEDLSGVFDKEFDSQTKVVEEKVEDEDFEYLLNDSWPGFDEPSTKKTRLQ